MKRAAKSNGFISRFVWGVLNVRGVRNAWSFMKWHMYKAFVKFNADGLNTTEKRDKKIIVSITSHPGRIDMVPYVIASVLKQSMKPDKIILWLGIGKFPDNKLPKVFEKVKACGVEVKFREDIRAHTKYFYAMTEYPDDIIITLDDDFVYEFDVIEKLYASYLEHPECVSAMRADTMTVSGDTVRLDIIPDEIKGREANNLCPHGVSGVLYPPHCVHPEAFNVEAMKKLCPLADDIWLKIMELLNGTKAVLAIDKQRVPGWLVDGSQAIALWHENNAGGNDRQLRAVIDAYNTWPKNGKTILEMIQEG